MQKFQIGDLVVNKLGGPIMMVIYDLQFPDSSDGSDNSYNNPIFTANYLCSWYEKGKRLEKYFNEDSLEIDE